MKKIVLFFFIIAISITCMEEYKYNNKNSEGLLVVEAQITDKLNEHYVNLSWSTEINEDNQVISGANAAVYGSDGSETIFSEVEPGIYKPLDNQFIALENIEYTLRIEIGNNIYTSSPIVLPKSLSIDSALWISSSLDPSLLRNDHKYVSIKVSSNTDESASAYYMYDLEETYQIKTKQPYKELYKVDFTQKFVELPFMHGTVYCEDGQMHEDFKILAPPEIDSLGYFTENYLKSDPYETFNICSDAILIEQNVDNFVTEIIDIDTVYKIKNEAPLYCWVNNYRRNTKIISLEGNVSNQLNNETVALVRTDDKLAIMYSCLIKQYAIDPNYYKFLEVSDKFTDNNPKIYNVQPGFVNGNIRNLANEEEKVIGYFNAASVSSKRIFINNKDLNDAEQQEVLLSLDSCHEYEFKIELEDTTTTPLPESDSARIIEEYFTQYEELRRSDSLKILRGLLKYNNPFHNNLISCCDESCYAMCEFFLINPYYCYDCRELGTPIKPEYWPLTADN